METSSTLLAHCAGNSPVTVEFLAQRPVTQSFDVFFGLCLNKRLSKQSWGWWFEMASRPLSRHWNATQFLYAGDYGTTDRWRRQNQAKHVPHSMMNILPNSITTTTTTQQTGFLPYNGPLVAVQRHNACPLVAVQGHNACPLSIM